MSKRHTSDDDDNGSGIDLDNYSRASLSTEQKVRVLWEVTQNQTREIVRLKRIVIWGTGFASAMSVMLGIVLALIGAGIISFGAGK